MATNDPLMNLKSGWGTMSIGGNDVGFFDIAASCLFSKGVPCQDDIANAQEMIDDPGLVVNLTKAYKAVIDASSRPNFLLVVTDYAQFFSIAEVEPCNSNHFFLGYNLTIKLRTQLNTLTANLNVAIQTAVNQTQASYSANSKQIMFFDTDPIYEGNRFCDPSLGGTWKLQKTLAWFFTIKGNDISSSSTTANNSQTFSGGEPDAQIDLTSLGKTCNPATLADPWDIWTCNYAIYLDGGGEPIDNLVGMAYPDAIRKAMHPKTIAHDGIGAGLMRTLSGMAQAIADNTKS